VIEKPKNIILFFSRPNNDYISYSLVANYGMEPKKISFQRNEIFFIGTLCAFEIA